MRTGYFHGFVQISEIIMSSKMSCPTVLKTTYYSGISSYLDHTAWTTGTVYNKQMSHIWQNWVLFFIFFCLNPTFFQSKSLISAIYFLSKRNFWPDMLFETTGLPVIMFYCRFERKKTFFMKLLEYIIQVLKKTIIFHDCFSQLSNNNKSQIRNSEE